MRKRTLPLSRPTVPTIGGRSLSYVPCPRCLLARRRGGSAGSRCGSPFFPRILIHLIRFCLLIVIQWIIRFQRQGVGLHLLADNLHRLAAYADFIRQDLCLFAFDHASHQQHDLFWLQAPSFTNRLAVDVVRLVTTPTPSIRSLATSRHPKSPRLQQSCSTMWAHHALRMKVNHQPFIAVLTRHQVHNGKLNGHNSPQPSLCPQFTPLHLSLT